MQQLGLFAHHAVTPAAPEPPHCTLCGAQCQIGCVSRQDVLVAEREERRADDPHAYHDPVVQNYVRHIRWLKRQPR
jgi:hypothetical protein